MLQSRTQQYLVPAIVVEWSLKPVTNNASSAADIEHVAKPSVQQFDSNKVRRPGSVAVDVAVTAVEKQPCRLRRSQLLHTISYNTTTKLDQLIAYMIQ